MQEGWGADNLRAGIFGAPNFAAGTEIFWGDDRMEDAIAWSKARA